MDAIAQLDRPLPEQDYIDITPLPHILFGMSAQNLPWWKAIGELVDNSFDAKATQVYVKCSGKTVSVSDDGRGMPDVASAITLGGHKGHGDGSLGRYGVGLKDAWRSAGERIEVVTVRGGVRSYLDFCLESIQLHDRSWRLPKPQVSETTEKSGTRIILHLREGKNKPGTDAWEMLGWAFTPALLTGRQIVQGNEKLRKAIAPCTFPAMTEAIRESFDVCGKRVTINIGIMASGERIFKGPFWVQYGHRNIVNSSIGVGSYSDEHLAGTITLGDGWRLTKNKDDFDDHKDELSAAIHDRIKPLLVKAEQMSSDVECKAMSEAIAGLLNKALAKNKREKRNRGGESSGTVTPKDSGRTRQRAKQVHHDKPGFVQGDGSNGKPHGFQHSWYYNENDGIGNYDYFGNRVRTNALHPFAAKLKSEGNTLALYAICAAIIADHHCNHDGATKLLCDIRNFSELFSNVTETLGGDV